MRKRLPPRAGRQIAHICDCAHRGSGNVRTSIARQSYLGTPCAFSGAWERITPSLIRAMKVSALRREECLMRYFWMRPRARTTPVGQSMDGRAVRGKRLETLRNPVRRKARPFHNHRSLRARFGQWRPALKPSSEITIATGLPERAAARQHPFEWRRFVCGKHPSSTLKRPSPSAFTRANTEATVVTREVWLDQTAGRTPSSPAYDR